MPAKTIYVKEADLALWEEAQEKLGESVSSIFADCLRERLAQHAQQSGVESMKKLTVTLWNQEDQPVVHQAFIGRWLISPEDDFRADDPDPVILWDDGACYAIAETQKGKLAVYTFHCNGRSAPTLDVYGSLEELRSVPYGEGVPENVIVEASTRLGVPYEIELDI